MSSWAASAVSTLLSLEVNKGKSDMKQKPPSQPMSANKLGLGAAIGIGIRAAIGGELNNIALGVG
jgi:hypothetical protein